MNNTSSSTPSNSASCSISWQEPDVLLNMSSFSFWTAALLEFSREGFTNAVMRRIRNHSCWQSLLIQENTHTWNQTLFRWGSIALHIGSSVSLTQTQTFTFSFLPVDNGSLVWHGGGGRWEGEGVGWMAGPVTIHSSSSRQRSKVDLFGQQCLHRVVVIDVLYVAVRDEAQGLFNFVLLTLLFLSHSSLVLSWPETASVSLWIHLCRGS